MLRTYFSDGGAVLEDQSFGESMAFAPLTATIWHFDIFTGEPLVTMVFS
jgi:hypothetical protein